MVGRDGRKMEDGVHACSHPTVGNERCRTAQVNHGTAWLSGCSGTVRTDAIRAGLLRKVLISPQTRSIVRHGRDKKRERRRTRMVADQLSQAKCWPSSDSALLGNNVELASAVLMTLLPRPARHGKQVDGEMVIERGSGGATNQSFSPPACVLYAGKAVHESCRD
jgi:hypothetical protein